MPCDKKGIRLLCMIMAALIMCSCSTPQIETSEIVPSAATPRPENERESPRYEAELYFPTSDSRRLLPESRQIIMDGNISHIEAALRALCGGASTQSQLSILQEGIEFEKAEVSSECCNVYFCGNVDIDEKQWLITRAAVAATVNKVQGIPYVNLYYHQMEPGYFGRPVGALSPILESLDVYIKNMELEYEALQKEREENQEEASFEMRNATIYCSDVQTGLLLAQNKVISYSAKAEEMDIADILIDAMKNSAAAENENIKSVFPAGFRLAKDPEFISDAEAAPNEPGTGADQGESEARKTETGIIELTFIESDCEYDEELLCGALTLTLTGYIPGIRGIRILSQDKNEETRNLSSIDLFTRDMFSDLIGCNIALDYPNEDGSGLYGVKRTVSNAESYLLGSRLQTLISEDAGTGVPFTGFMPNDVQNVYITGDTAVIDWKAGFSDKLRALETAEGISIPEERRIWIYIYSIINTMTEFPGIQRVWMLEDGRKMGAIGDIYLGNALMRNPGIMLELPND